MDLTRDIAMLIGGPAAAMALLWFVLVHLLPKRDQLFAETLREISAANASALSDLGQRLDHHTDRVTERLDSVIAALSDRPPSRASSR